jgi:hypothetical protein
MCLEMIPEERKTNLILIVLRREVLGRRQSFTHQQIHVYIFVESILLVKRT